ncbi:toll/interleukin-1 receptor domain-containing protein [Conexibacter woesei]|uniref:TIR domain-containing protein n=1 Tax=Conexibacter woesei (strain DSM 14684 / CCUG 47730 / CIP 108061 / JCM 11494 / NBRC 100937 / ID131577) TaxID=469383 RepID=D3F4W3_CONWI|nr:toll/interleukin-1 receptor domain-containing protein [Conexibacter woesei]ADB48541.1 hypothetical protein Cwoe_0105 [Conexibacter woesei DSM 14684]
MSAAAPKVFLSYRREETAGHAGRLYDAIATRFGDANVFMDVELAPGIDFVDRITEAVGECRALLVVIGPRWASVTAAGRPQPRIAEPGDYVRLEVETALARSDVRVIPVLVAGARMPPPAQLPPSLQGLARRNAIELSDLRWRYDVGRLSDTLGELVAGASADDEGEPHAIAATAARSGPAAARSGPAAAPQTGSASLVLLLLEAIALAAAAGMLARLLAEPIHADALASDAEHIATLVLRRAVTWAIVGAVLGVWLSVRRGERSQTVGRLLGGFVLGAAAGALGGAIFGAAVILPAEPVAREVADRISIGAMAATGAVLGAAIGALWTPRRVAVGLLAGAAGGVVVQLLRNQLGQPSDVVAVGFQCVGIVGFAVSAQLFLDVRAAAVSRQPVRA